MATVVNLFPSRQRVHILPKQKFQIVSDYKITPTKRKDEFLIEWDGEALPNDATLFGKPIRLDKSGYVLVIDTGTPIASWNKEKDYSGHFNKKNVATVSMN